MAYYVRLAPYLVTAVFASSYWIPLMANLGFWLVIAHLLFSLGYAGRINQIGGKFDKISALLRTISAALTSIEHKDWQSRLMVGLSERIRSGGLRDSAYPLRSGGLPACWKSWITG